MALQQPHARVIACQRKSALAISDALTQQQIRMLFFCGHGETIELELEAKIQTVGKIYLDKDTPISIGKIKTDLKQAIERGLQIAILNYRQVAISSSCPDANTVADDRCRYQ